MTRQLHGMLSLLLLIIAILLGAASIFLSSVLLTAVYLGLAFLLSMLLIISFCSKCPCRENGCAHVLPGKLTVFLPRRADGPYSILDYLGAVFPILFILIFPQFWLMHKMPLLVVFWVLILLALLQIHFELCNGCGNRYCPASKNTQQIKL